MCFLLDNDAVVEEKAQPRACSRAIAAVMKSGCITKEETDIASTAGPVEEQMLKRKASSTQHGSMKRVGS